MPKAKTQKSAKKAKSSVRTKQTIAKRFTVKKSGKVIKRRDGQDHFNARQSGNTKRRKRSDSTVTTTGMTKTIARNV